MKRSLSWIKKFTCGWSPHGNCIGWHLLIEEEYLNKKSAFEAKSAVKHNIKDLEMEKAATFAALVSRVFISLIFIMFGFNKLFNYGATAGWMEAMGVPGFFLPFVKICEVFGGIAVIIGWQTRWIALGLAGFSVLSVLIFHNNFADQNEMVSVMKNIAIAGNFLF